MSVCDTTTLEIDNGTENGGNGDSSIDTQTLILGGVVVIGGSYILASMSGD